MGRRIVVGFWMMLLTLSVYVGEVHAQPFDIKARVSKRTIRIGETIELELSTRYNPMEWLIQFPTVPDSFNGFELIQKNKIDTLTKREINEYTWKHTLTHFDSGRWCIPPFDFTIQSKKGDQPFTQRTDSIWIDVQTIPVDTAKPFQPIADIREAKRPWYDSLIEWGWKIGLILFLLGALAGIIIFVRSKRKPVTPLALGKQQTPYERAIESLQVLEQQKRHEEEDSKPYYTELTTILRTYLDAQFNLDCQEKTTSEIMQVVKKQKALANTRQDLRKVLEEADLVKFAKGKPTHEEHLHYLTLVRDIVQEANRKWLQTQPISVTETQNNS